ncbi:ATP-binding protein [Streptacidiphilus jiangxiensis]|uniref:Predicted ATPase n=1 Tax=Streptacidiphilus jiangxiensis TaxID=235985 RepID=A0A1H7PR85_STRJI|nr:BTAD domain-containing putative transcriptional regulator [Streptacidiphilus jiangxiensis]SEL37547.1 Predicted ATPase [Streptacidiphilus jiangxiensis]
MTIELTLLPRVSCRGQEVTSARLRGLLALLAGELRAGCSTALLVDGLWPDAQPENPAKALQVLVSRARAQLGTGLIVTTPSGYRLDLAEDQVDSAAVLLRAAAAAQQAREGDHAASLAHAEAGLALWEGEADAQAAPAPGTQDGARDEDDPVAALRAGRAPVRRALARARALALARLTRYDEAAPALAQVVRARPRDEEALLELLRAEAATVGPPAALARYEHYRRSLRDELGVDPGAPLQTLQRTLLEGEVPLERHGLPHEPNELVGRDADIAAVSALLRSARVTSVVGPGGLGKTRLAQVVSRAAEQRVVHFVPLAAVTRDEDVAAEVVAAVAAHAGARSAVPGRAPADDVSALVEALGSGPVLLVLDNCEQVVAGVADIVQVLVQRTKDLRVLTTSRAPLGLSSESVYLLPELGPEQTAELFRRRARAARPDVELPEDAVRALCGHLDGLPLAAELAAARVRVLSVAEITRRLTDRFALLRGGSRDAPQRHRTLRAVVDWSWNLLDADGRAAMRALSVFPGGFTATAAQHLLDALSAHEEREEQEGEELDALELVEHLVDQSLLKAADTPSGLRFHMLETVREFSADQREAQGGTEATTEALLAWARAFGLAEFDAPFGADLAGAGDRIRAELENLTLALRLGLARQDGDTVAATSAALAGLWTVEARYNRMAVLDTEVARLLSHHRPSSPAYVEAVRAVSTLCATNLFLVRGPHAVRSLVTLRRLPPGSPTSLVRALATVLCVSRDALVAGDPGPLLALTGDEQPPLLAAVARATASYAAEAQGDPETALGHARGMLRAFEHRGGSLPLLEILAHSRISELCLLAEQPAEAERHLRAALLLQERVGWRSDVIGLRWALMLTHLQLGNPDEAERWLEQAALHHVDETVDSLLVELGGRAEIALVRGETELGLGFWRRAVERLRDYPRLAPDGRPLAPGETDSLEPWILEIHAVAVAAHAQHGRGELVSDLSDQLARDLTAMLMRPQLRFSPAGLDLSRVGAGLLALAYLDLERGRTAPAARRLALAERVRYARNFQPTMSAERARTAAWNADRPAYDEAVSSYAGLDPEGLRLAALEALADR